MTRTIDLGGQSKVKSQFIGDRKFSNVWIALYVSLNDYALCAVAREQMEKEKDRDFYGNIENHYYCDSFLPPKVNWLNGIFWVTDLFKNKISFNSIYSDCLALKEKYGYGNLEILTNKLQFTSQLLEHKQLKFEPKDFSPEETPLSLSARLNDREIFFTDEIKPIFNREFDRVVNSKSYMDNQSTILNAIALCFNHRWGYRSFTGKFDKPWRY